MTIMIRMDTLERDYEFVQTGIYRNKASKKYFDATFDNGLAYLERRLDMEFVW